MRPGWLMFKPGCRKAVVLVLLLNILLLLARPDTASADSGCIGVPAETLTIKVGYFGGPYYIKKIYTLSDLEALPQVQQAYTFIDSMPAVVIDSAKGVKLTDILEDAGIDVNSVEDFYFYSTDIKVGWYQRLPKTYLLDTTRYYYPNLPAYWDLDTHSSKPGAVDGAVVVEPMIALWDNWQRFATAPDFSVKDISTRFRLLFGQTDTVTVTSHRSVKWVHAIEVMLGGTPPGGVSLDQDLINLKVGSTVRLTATVGPDDATDKSVVWSSSDTGVAIVDGNGVVTVVGPGTAVITVTTMIGNFTATCVVNGSSQDGGISAGAPGNQAPVDAAGTAATAVNRLSPGEKSAAVAIVESSGNPLAEAGYQPWRIYEMSADAVPLQEQVTPSIPDIYAQVIFLVLLLLGVGKGYAEYVREI